MSTMTTLCILKKNITRPKLLTRNCCDIGQIDIFSGIELFPSIVLSSDNTNYRNDIQLFPSYLMSLESMKITINTYRRYEQGKQWNGTSHISSLKVTVSHIIVILFILTCQLTSKSNSHMSQSVLFYCCECI